MSQFSFIPWVRNTLAAKAGLAHTPARLVLPITVNVAVNGGSASEQVTVNADLHGPGSVVGINPEAVLKTLPAAGEQQFPSLLVAAVEFYEEDLPWRYSPPVPSTPPPAGAPVPHVAPWCCLLALEENSAEYREVEQGTRPLPVIEAPNADNFPPAAQLWLWAHVQVNQALDGGTTNAFLDGTLRTNPDLAFSRVMSARRLKANTAYRAFLVPSFEAGREAGLGLPVSASVTEPSWNSTMGPTLFPVYYQWSFRTGEAGDFESLARRLRPVQLADFGSQPMTVRTPLGGQGVPRSGDWIVNLPGVLRPFGAVPPPPAELAQELQEELAPALAPPAAPASGRPAVTPPIYGRSYANPLQLPNPGTAPPSGWLSQTNLDPRYRVIAGLGNQIIQDNQEEYTNRAWEQVRDVLEANMNLRGMQSGLQTTSALRTQHLPLTGGTAGQRVAARQAKTSEEPPKIEEQPKMSTSSEATSAPADATVAEPTNEEVPVEKSITGPGVDEATEPGSMENYGLHLTGLAFSRVLVPGKGATVQEVIRQSNMPMAAFSPTFRRIAKPFGRYQTSLAGRPQRPTDPTPTDDAQTLLEARTTLPQRDALLTLLNQGTITAAPPKPQLIRAYQFDDGQMDLLLSEGETPGELLVLVDGKYQIYTYESEQYNAFDNAYSTFRDVRFNTQDIPRPPLDLEEIKQALIEGTRPEPVYLARAKKALRVVPHYGSYDTAGTVSQISAGVQARGTAAIGTPVANPAPTLQELKPVMAYPVFKDPMGEALRRKYPDLFMPGVEDFPANGLTLLSVNRAFIEAYMLGLNHALGSELLWRGFPIELRGSFFRQFWDVSDLLSTTTSDTQSPTTLAQAEENLRDIQPLHLWLQRALGTNAPITGPADQVRLAIRADLLLRYPNTVIAALPAIKNGAGELEPNFGGTYVYPTRRMMLGQDILVLTFPLSEVEVQGNPASSLSGPYGHFFILQERPGEPHFGLDEWVGTANPSFPPSSWDDLSWQHLQADEGEVITLPFTAGTTLAPFTAITDSAKLAYVLFQQPFMVAIHAAEMIPA
ncbi:hypothetical protein GCM10023185_33250 [Hymenobacter saemangeumensis]|uniref:Uncharacterized protein n=1 Tax=Hymenobacter saemangeumensis TaxID=1084522 RepID=A0ABP8IN85_9BACT